MKKKFYTQEVAIVPKQIVKRNIVNVIMPVWDVQDFVDASIVLMIKLN